jgi:hypothetical protein
VKAPTRYVVQGILLAALSALWFWVVAFVDNSERISFTLLLAMEIYFFVAPVALALLGLSFFFRAMAFWRELPVIYFCALSAVAAVCIRMFEWLDGS